MNDKWVRVEHGPAHCVKMERPPYYYLAACGAILPRSTSSTVPVERVHLANAVGRFYFRPAPGIEACAICLEKSREQAG